VTARPTIIRWDLRRALEDLASLRSRGRLHSNPIQLQLGQPFRQLPAPATLPGPLTLSAASGCPGGHNHLLVPTTGPPTERHNNRTPCQQQRGSGCPAGDCSATSSRKPVRRPLPGSQPRNHRPLASDLPVLAMADWTGIEPARSATAARMTTNDYALQWQSWASTRPLPPG